jgi:hypothetical protein
MAMLVNAIETHLSDASPASISSHGYSDFSSQECDSCVCTQDDVGQGSSLDTQQYTHASTHASTHAATARQHTTLLASKLSSSAYVGSVADSSLVPRAAMVYDNQRRSLSDSLKRCIVEKPSQFERHQRHLLALSQARGGEVNGGKACPRYWAGTAHQ